MEQENKVIRPLFTDEDMFSLNAFYLVQLYTNA